MKLVAQRVVERGTQARGVNVFHYVHGPYVWSGEPPPDIGHGQLQFKQTSVTPGGNTVLSYLDIVAPDETPTATVLQAFAIVCNGSSPPPFTVTVGNCTFESNMVQAFRRGWREELTQLFSLAISARISVHH